MVKDTLIDALEVQLQLLEEFFNLLNSETVELAAVHLDAMSEINVRKESMASRMDAHSTLLRKELTTAAVREGLPSKATLGELAEVYKRKGKAEIPRLHKELNRCADKVREVAAVNRDIAERFAESVATSLTLLTRLVNQSNVYGMGGYTQQRVGAVMINREA